MAKSSFSKKHKQRTDKHDDLSVDGVWQKRTYKDMRLGKCGYREKCLQEQNKENESSVVVKAEKMVKR